MGTAVADPVDAPARRGDDAHLATVDPGDHAPVVKPSRTVPWLEDRFFARFRPLSSAGTIDGRDPVGEALSRDLAAAPSRG